MRTQSPVQRLFIRKQALKFSASHMTVFADGTKERLHGHNYQTELVVDIATPAAENLIAFSVFKTALSEICSQWDEKFLLATGSPFLNIEQTASTVDFRLCGERYQLPKNDVELLPIENTTSESLSRHGLDLLLAKLKNRPDFPAVRALELKIEESPGQGASARWEAEK